MQRSAAAAAVAGSQQRHLSLGTSLSLQLPASEPVQRQQQLLHILAQTSQQHIYSAVARRCRPRLRSSSSPARPHFRITIPTLCTAPLQALRTFHCTLATLRCAHAVTHPQTPMHIVFPPTHLPTYPHARRVPSHPTDHLHIHHTHMHRVPSHPPTYPLAHSPPHAPHPVAHFSHHLLAHFSIPLRHCTNPSTHQPHTCRVHRSLVIAVLPTLPA